MTQSIKPACENLRQPHYALNPFGIHVIVASEPASACPLSVVRMTTHFPPFLAFNEDQWYSVNNGQFVLVDRRKNPWTDIPREMFAGHANEAANIEVTFEDFDPVNEV